MNRTNERPSLPWCELLEGRQLLSTIPATNLGPNLNATTSDNWSGYVVLHNASEPQQHFVSAVSGSWIVPLVTAPSTGAAHGSVWVGIDGYGNSTLEQVGTEEDVVNGKAVYYAWWEMYSSGGRPPEQPITSMTVEPGDSISATVQYVSSGAHAGEFDLSIVDASRANDSFTTYQTSSQMQSPVAEGSSAEWIVEAPTADGDIATLPNFGSVVFSNATAVINGVSGPIKSPWWNSLAVDQVAGGNGQVIDIALGGVTDDTTSVRTSSGRGFVVTDNASAGLATRGPVNVIGPTQFNTAARGLDPISIVIADTSTNHILPGQSGPIPQDVFSSDTSSNLSAGFNRNLLGNPSATSLNDPTETAAPGAAAPTGTVSAVNGRTVVMQPLFDDMRLSTLKPKRTASAWIQGPPGED